MDFDTRRSAAKECPVEERHAEVYDCGIDSTETSVKFEFLCDSPLLCKRHNKEANSLKIRVSRYILALASVFLKTSDTLNPRLYDLLK